MHTPAVTSNELLLRQIGPGGNPIFFDSSKCPPVHPSVFRPTEKDADGLSLIRGRFRTDVWAAYRMEQPSVRFRLARLSVSRLSNVAVALGIPELSFPTSPDGLDRLHGEPWAHCVVSEINRTAYEADRETKKRIKEWALAVAQSIAIDDVVGPYDEPTEDQHPYRPVESNGG